MSQRHLGMPIQRNALENRLWGKGNKGLNLNMMELENTRFFLVWIFLVWFFGFLTFLGANLSNLNSGDVDVATGPLQHLGWIDLEGHTSVLSLAICQPSLQANNGGP